MEEVGVARPGRLFLFSCPLMVDSGEAPWKQNHGAWAKSGHFYIAWCHLASVLSMILTFEFALLCHELKGKFASGAGCERLLSHSQSRFLSRARLAF